MNLSKCYVSTKLQAVVYVKSSAILWQWMILKKHKRKERKKRREVIEYSKNKIFPFLVTDGKFLLNGRKMQMKEIMGFCLFVCLFVSLGVLFGWFFKQELF